MNDVTRFVSERNLDDKGALQPLTSYAPAQIEIQDKYSFSTIDYSVKQYDTHQTFWELQSSVARNQSKPNFF